MRQVVVANSQFSCEANPDPRKVDIQSDTDISLYISRLESAGESCRAQLRRVKDALQVQGVEITDVVVTAVKQEQ